MTTIEKYAVKSRKLKIQTIQKNKMRIVVDMPNRMDKETLNDGNTARRFFQRP